MALEIKPAIQTQQTVKSNQNKAETKNQTNEINTKQTLSNSTKYMIGATALAATIAFGIIGHKNNWWRKVSKSTQNIEPKQNPVSNTNHNLHNTENINNNQVNKYKNEYDTLLNKAKNILKGSDKKLNRAWKQLEALNTKYKYAEELYTQDAYLAHLKKENVRFIQDENTLTILDQNGNKIRTHVYSPKDNILFSIKEYKSNKKSSEIFFDKIDYYNPQTQNKHLLLDISRILYYNPETSQLSKSIFKTTRVSPGDLGKGGYLELTKYRSNNKLYPKNKLRHYFEEDSDLKNIDQFSRRIDSKLYIDYNAKNGSPQRYVKDLHNGYNFYLGNYLEDPRIGYKSPQGYVIRKDKNDINCIHLLDLGQGGLHHEEVIFPFPLIDNRGNLIDSVVENPMARPDIANGHLSMYIITPDNRKLRYVYDEWSGGAGIQEQGKTIFSKDLKNGIWYDKQKGNEKIENFEDIFAIYTNYFFNK